MERLGTGELTELFPDPLWSEARGVFVTLHALGRLRGCIGYIEAVEPLGQAVRTMACQAAFHDPRFRPVTADELAGIDVEISVLSPLKPARAEAIVPGVHGVVIEARGRRAVFLPQVATEHGWDRETLLEELCHKAGLEGHIWREEDARLFVFTAEVFGERES